MENLRKTMEPNKLEYLDSIAQIVARLYEENADKAYELGGDRDELKEAVYTLGQAYMLLYNQLLDQLPPETTNE